MHLESRVSTGWHLHQAPLFAQVLAGELTVDYGIKGLRIYRAGESFLEAVDWLFNGTKTCTVPVRILAVYLGSDTREDSVLLLTL